MSQAGYRISSRPESFVLFIKKYVSFFKRLFSFINEDVPIIFETPIQDIETQGVIEVKEFFSGFNN